MAGILDLLSRHDSDIGRFQGHRTSSLHRRSAVRQILQHIGSGDCYQVNYTCSLGFQYFGSPLALYRLLRVQQPVQHGAFVQLAGRSILSLSPELFLERRGHQLRMRPMKGTIQEAGAAEADLADILRNSGKDRAENLMIVDLMRNDLSRLAEIGTVKVEELFAIESYPRLLQMVSTPTPVEPTPTPPEPTPTPAPTPVSTPKPPAESKRSREADPRTAGEPRPAERRVLLERSRCHTLAGRSSFSRRARTRGSRHRRLRQLAHRRTHADRSGQHRSVRT